MNFSALWLITLEYRPDRMSMMQESWYMVTVLDPREAKWKMERT